MWKSPVQVAIFLLVLLNWCLWDFDNKQGFPYMIKRIVLPASLCQSVLFVPPWLSAVEPTHEGGHTGLTFSI